MPALAHFGIALMTKRFTPHIPLWVLLIGAMFLDLLSFVFILAPLWSSHGLFMALVWTGLTMSITYISIKSLESKKENNVMVWGLGGLKVSLIFGLLVFSHWILDLIGWPMTVINPNSIGTPLLFDDAVNIGMGVYSTWVGALSMDIGVFIIGLVVYLFHLKKQKNLDEI
jgi:hypothetical protein